MFGIEPVDTRGNDGVNRVRHFDGIELFGQSVSASLTSEGSHFHEGAHALFQEEGIALRPSDQHGLQGGKLRIPAEDLPEQLLDTLGRQGVNAELPIVSPAAPVMSKLGPVVD